MLKAQPSFAHLPVMGTSSRTRHGTPVPMATRVPEGHVYPDPTLSILWRQGQPIPRPCSSWVEGLMSLPLSLSKLYPVSLEGKGSS